MSRFVRSLELTFKRTLNSAVAISLLTSCAHPPIIPSEKSVLIQTESKDVQIFRINGVPQEGFRTKFATKKTLEPGKYVVSVMLVGDDRPLSGKMFELEAQPGRIYTVKHKTDESSRFKATDFWVEDSTSLARVGRVLLAGNEPVDQDHSVYEQSNFFRWTVPQNEGWRCGFRDGTQSFLAKDGAAEHETFILSVKMGDIPLLSTLDEFTEWIRSDRLKPEVDLKRIEIITQSISPLSGYEDFCVEERSIFIDKKPRIFIQPKDPLLYMGEEGSEKGKGPMKNESVNFICRHPRNRNLIFNFELRHIAYDRTPLEGIAALAKRYFEGFEFR